MTRLERPALLIVLVGCLMMAISCSHSKTTSVPPKASYSYEVRGEGSASAGMGQTANTESGKNRLEIKNGQLTVNGDSYGSLANGDKVLVELDGRVFVNGEARQPK